MHFGPTVKMGQNGLQRGPKESKCGQKRGQPVSKRAQLGSKRRKMASTRVKMGQNGSKCGPEGSHAAQGVKMAFSRPNLPKSSPERVHPALQDGRSWNWDPSAEGTPARFPILPKSVHRVPPLPMYMAHPPGAHLIVLPKNVYLPKLPKKVVF